MTSNDIKSKFNKKFGFFGQEYYSLRTPGFEITIDNLTPSSRYLVCLCTPYNEKVDQKKKHEGVGGGEVKESWMFEDEDQALTFITRHHLI